MSQEFVGKWIEDTVHSAVEKNLEKTIEVVLKKYLEKYIPDTKKEQAKTKNERLLTTKEVQELLHCSRGTVNNLINAKELNPIQYSTRKNLFEYQDVDRLINQFSKTRRRKL